MAIAVQIDIVVIVNISHYLLAIFKPIASAAVPIKYGSN